MRKPRRARPLAAEAHSPKVTTKHVAWDNRIEMFGYLLILKSLGAQGRLTTIRSLKDAGWRSNRQTAVQL